ncbi:MAG TPA: TrkA C-terminal domain-containing protein, partial [Clostridia bacterium]|nr:TrkA C-terminal domain-containing protein [Clostridia bacterium]
LILNPDLQAASEIARLLQFPTALSIEPFAHNRVNMVEIEIPDDHDFIGKNLITFRESCPDVLVCVVVREGVPFIPYGSTILQANDHLFITGTIAKLRAVYRMFADSNDPLRSILIVGGGRITFYVLKRLAGQGFDIKVIEQDAELARELSEDFPDVHVVHGDGTDQELLEEEGIRYFDFTLALTGVDEENILISLFGISQEVPRNITKVNRLRLLRVLQNMDLQSIITPHEIVATEIIRTVRALNQDNESNMEAMYRIAQGQVEAMEFHVVQASNVCGRNLADLPIKRGILVAYIIRGPELIVPGGKDFIEPGDHVIVVTNGHAIVNIDDILD